MEFLKNHKKITDTEVIILKEYIIEHLKNNFQNKYKIIFKKYK